MSKRKRQRRFIRQPTAAAVYAAMAEGRFTGAAGNVVERYLRKIRR